MGKVKTTISKVSDEEFEKLLSADIDLKFVKERAQEHFSEMVKLTNNDFAVISIDMQPTFLRNIGNIFGKKIKILSEYHKELKILSNTHQINFIEIEYRKLGDNILKNKNSLIFLKGQPAIDNEDFFDYLKKNNIENLFMIGINRNACVLNSMTSCYQKNFKLFTSLIGTGSHGGHIENAKNIKSSELSLKEFFRQARMMKVRILDYDESRLAWRL